jgi:hypothetical protein
MTRILADFPDEDIKWLDGLAEEQGKSRAAVLREIVTAQKERSLARRRQDWIERGAGYWKGRADIGDPIEYQRSMREDRTCYKDL